MSPMKASHPGWGSSPLARGLRFGHNSDRQTARIIPARAGFTTQEHARQTGAWDHPRSRGVYCGAHLAGEAHGGSSPLARGLLSPMGTVSRFERIIPARAGFTLLPVELIGGHADHPRSRGVYRFSPYGAITRAGSSPLARGLPLRSGPGPRTPRIIPARAGFTHGGPSLPYSPVDHPRSRGVYHMSRLTKLLLARIIPARAGFTR